MTEGVFPKTDGDILFSSEVNDFGRAAGEGIDLSGGTISAELATTTNKGVASFNSSHFAVSSGAVSLLSQGVESVAAGEGIDVSASTGDVTISAELATTSNKGVASFNSSHFAVSSGAVSLKSKTSYKSYAGVAFLVNNENDEFDRNNSGQMANNATSADFFLPLHLPHGSLITDTIVWGDAVGETWFLYRTNMSAGTSENWGSNNFGSTETANVSIDNNTYAYFIGTSGLGSSDEIYGCRVTYTTNYD